MATNVATLTPAKAFDLVQEMLGIGEVEPDGPAYGPWRVKQIAMLKKMMERRGIRPADVVLCAEYCRAHRLQPETYAWLLMHIDSAYAWRRQRAQRPVQDVAEFEEAITYERQLADADSSRWLEMLTRAAPQVRGEVLAQWKAARQL